MGRFINIEAKKKRVNRFNFREQPEKIQVPKILVRSNQENKNRESFWSKLQISLLEIGSTPYSNYRISIYGPEK